MSTPPGSFDPIGTGTGRPAPQAGLIRRDRIIGHLTSAQQPALVAALVAPAGYGKTTVLSQWAEQDPLSFAWVVIDDADNDPVRLVRHMVSALQRIEPHDPAL